MKINCKEDICSFLDKLMLPMLEGEFHVKKELAHYSPIASEFEEFSRFCLGLTSYLAIHNNDRLLSNTVEQLLRYIDPASEQYIDINGREGLSQIYVEMFPPLFMMYTYKDKIENIVSDNKRVICDFFSHIFKQEYENNWIWFQIMVNVLLYKIGVRPFDEAFNNKCHDKLSRLYCNGYYTDGPHGEVDNYNSFAFFYYSVIYIKLMGKEDQKYAGLYLKQIKDFMPIYCSYFSDKGVIVPEGRSLTYKFAVLGYIGALVYADLEIIDYGYMKDLVFKFLDIWSNKDIFCNGYLTNGYYYENMNILEDYNSYGSPYWAFKPFIMLTTDNKKFWQAERKDFSLIKKDITLPRLIIRSYEGEQYLFPVLNGRAHHCSLFNDKYEKNVYSSLFGFSVSKGMQRETIGIDSTFAISFDNERFTVRSDISAELAGENIIKSYYTYAGISIVQYQLIQVPYVTNIYIIESPCNFFMLEGAYPIEYNEIRNVVDDWNIVCNGEQCSGIRTITSDGFYAFDKQYPQSNIYYRKTSVPVCMYRVNKGRTFHVTETYGGKCVPRNFMSPEIRMSNTCMNIQFGSINYQLDTFQKIKAKNRFIKKARYMKKFLRMIRR